MNNTLVNGTYSCSFPSIGSLLATAEAGNLNITQLVQSCPNVCSLAWGTGNPDLSGIGANISYIMQFVSIVIFGPLFVAIYGYGKQGHLSPDSLEFWKELQDTFLDTSAQFTIPVTVAAVVRLHQSPPFFEIAFLQSLTTMQFLGLFCTAIATGVAMPKRRSIRRVLVISLYLVVDFGFYMGVVGYLRTNKASWTTIKQLASACGEYSQLTPGFVYIQTHKLSVGTGIQGFKNFLNPFSKGGWIIFGLTVAAVAGLAVTVVVVFAIYQCLRSRSSWVLGPMSLGFFGGTLYCMVLLERKRQVMKRVTGSDFQDNQWGFGQVMALFLWAPLLVQSLYYILVTLFPRLKPRELVSTDRACYRCRGCHRCAESGESSRLMEDIELSPVDAGIHPANPPTRTTPRTDNGTTTGIDSETYHGVLLEINSPVVKPTPESDPVPTRVAPGVETLPTYAAIESKDISDSDKFD